MQDCLQNANFRATGSFWYDYRQVQQALRVWHSFTRVIRYDKLGWILCKKADYTVDIDGDEKLVALEKFPFLRLQRQKTIEMISDI